MSVLLVLLYASPPLNLRLSPGERGKETKVPVAFQRRLARAQFHVPDLEGLVPGCRHDGLAVGRKNTRRDQITAIFCIVREHICCGRLRLSPPESTPLPR